MPLFRQPEVRPEREKQKPRKRNEKIEGDEDEDEPSSLRRLCVVSLAENMKEVWTRDYAHNYMDQYFFRYVMGPFNLLPGDLIEELLYVLSKRSLLSRASLHLLLLPQVTSLSLSQCSNLVTHNLCTLISARCQSLKSLDLSGALNISAAPLGSLLSSLPRLQYVSLAGTACNGAVIATLSRECPALQHLDVSRCLQLRPAALLPLACEGRSHLVSLLAVDIGLGEGELEAWAAAAFLMLSLPRLRCLASEGLGRACEVLQKKDFDLTEGFSCREGVPRLKELWELRMREKMEPDRSCSKDTRELKETLRLRLRDVQGVLLRSLQAVADLCPEVSALSLNCYDDFNSGDATPGMLLTQGLARWSGHLLSLSLQFPGPLSDLVPALNVSGSSLRYLALEGVRADGLLSFVTLIGACPRLQTLTIHIEPPTSDREDNHDHDNDEGIEDRSLPCLPDLQTLTLNFSLDERQLRPVLCWTPLRAVLWSLLRGAPNLRALSLLAMPCRLDAVFQTVLDGHTEPLRCLRQVSLRRSDVTVVTAMRLLDACGRLVTLDVSGCWLFSLRDVKKLQSLARRRRQRLQIIWT